MGTPRYKYLRRLAFVLNSFQKDRPQVNIRLARDFINPQASQNMLQLLLYRCTRSEQSIRPLHKLARGRTTQNQTKRERLSESILWGILHNQVSKLLPRYFVSLFQGLRA